MELLFILTRIADRVCIDLCCVSTYFFDRLFLFPSVCKCLFFIFVCSKTSQYWDHVFCLNLCRLRHTFKIILKTILPRFWRPYIPELDIAFIQTRYIYALFEIFRDLAASLSLLYPWEVLMLNYWHVSWMQGKQQVPNVLQEKIWKKRVADHIISKQHPMTAYLNRNAKYSV